MSLHGGCSWARSRMNAAVWQRVPYSRPGPITHQRKFLFDVPVDTLLWEECSGWADVSYGFPVHLQISRKRSDSVGWHEKLH